MVGFNYHRQLEVPITCRRHKYIAPPTFRDTTRPQALVAKARVELLVFNAIALHAILTEHHYIMAAHKLTYLAGSPDGTIQVKSSTRAIGGVEVLVRVTHSGVCGTDVHDRTAGCGLGHEGVGIVEKVGDAVTVVKVGQRVGWG